MNRRILTIFALIITLSATIFYFMQNERDNAINVLFIWLYFTVTLYLILRILFYFRYKATLNEIFFVFVANITICLVIFAEPYVPISSEKLITVAFALDPNTTITLYLTVISYLSLPYFLFSIILQIRSFTKYEFFRISPTAEKGIKAEWVAILIYLIFGVVFFVLCSISYDLLAVFFGIYFVFNGFVFLFAK